MSHAPARAGFTLLETVLGLAILGLALMAIFDLNAGALANHAYSKRLTVASLLARSKMTDLEQELYDKGFSADDDEQSGDFSDEGWPSFKWRARILAPRTTGVDPMQLMSALFNLPLDGSGTGLAALFGGGAGAAGGAAAGGPMGGMAGAAAGPLAGMMGQQMQQMVDQLGKAVREVHLTVSWKDGRNVESVDVVTHVVSLGPGSDRNGLAGPAAAQANGQQGLRRPDGNPPRGTPSACPGNPAAFCDVDGTPLSGGPPALPPGVPSGGPAAPGIPQRGQLLPGTAPGRVAPIFPSLGGTPRGP
jgi:general secretion pathway protein I